MIIGQDWGDVGYYVANKGKDKLSNPTMVTLEGLLHGIGVHVSLASYETGASSLFLTNAVLCLKKGGLQGAVERQWFANCQNFLRRQIEIVNPRVVVTLGQRAYEAVSAAFSLPTGGFREAVDDKKGALLPCGARLLPVYHCGRRILNTHRPLRQQQKDWRRVAEALQR